MTAGEPNVPHKCVQVTSADQADGSVLLRPTNHQDRGLFLTERAQWECLQNAEGMDKRGTGPEMKVTCEGHHSGF